MSGCVRKSPDKLLAEAREYAGKGDYRTIQGAVNSLPDSSVTPRIITIKNGTYTEKLYIEKSLESRFSLNERTIEYIDKQLQEVSLSLNEIEDTMRLYKRSKNILDLDWERKDFFEKMSSYDAQKTTLSLKIEAMNDLEKYIIEDRDPDFLPPNVFLARDDGFMNKSVDELYILQIEINEQLSFSKEINPHIIEKRDKVKKLKQNILVYLSNARNATHISIENIKLELSKYIGQIKDIPSHQQDLLNIQRKVSVNETLYNFLLQSKANTKIGKAAIVPEIQIIDSPRNLGVIKPDKNKIKIIFLLSGLAVALIIVFVRVAFFTTIETWAVFKSNRQQSGELLHFAQRFIHKRARKSWQEVDIKPPHLVYLPRLEIYAENLSEYRERRKLFDDYGIEIPLKLVRGGDLMVIYSYAHEQKSLMNYVVEKSDDWKLSEILE